MTDFLLRIFVKNNENTSDPQVREKYGVLSGGVGIACNIFLCIIKFFAGFLTGAISIMADAFNNLSDAGTAVVTLIGFKLAGKPADKDHPYGHGRYEYITGLAIAAVIVLMGFELLKTSVSKIINPQEIEFSVTSIIILICAVFIKLWMSRFNKKLGKKINSSAMLATAADSLYDCISTTVVLFSILIGRFAGINIDGFVGVFVAFFILWAGVNTARETIEPLLGKAPDPDFVLNIERKILENNEIIGIHDMNVHDYGPGRIFISLHAEIPHTMNIMKAHDIIDDIEDEISKTFNCEISIHMDPVVIDDEKTNNLKSLVNNIVKSIDNCLSIHDFRITDGPLRTNMIFDVVVPFNFRMTDNEVQEYINQQLKQVNSTYYAVIKIDKASL